jgi:hypothetical protein
LVRLQSVASARTGAIVGSPTITHGDERGAVSIDEGQSAFDECNL